MANPVLELSQVSFVRHSVVILSDVDWKVRPGENWIVLGPNGSGKSTLVSLAGLARHPSSGRITVLGHELSRIDIRPLSPDPPMT